MSASSVLGEEVSAAGKGSSSSSAEIAGLSTAVVGNERTFGWCQRSHVLIKEADGAVAVGIARFAHASASVMSTSILTTVSVPSRTASRVLRLAVRRHACLPTVYF